MALADAILLCAGMYAAVGVVVALVFVVFGASRLDAAADGASFWFRPMIFPGCVVLWPFIVGRLLSFRKINKPIEGEE